MRKPARAKGLPSVSMGTRLNTRFTADFMKRLLKGFFVLAVALLPLLSFSCAQNPQDTVTASFYPMYTMALNLTRGVEELRVVCLASDTAGCVHDYQMTAANRKTLADTDLLILEGAGMEPFLDAVLPSLSCPVVDLSQGIDLLETRSEHGEGMEPNAHVWVSIPRMRQQLRVLTAALSAAYPEHAETFETNRVEYDGVLAGLYADLGAALAPFKGMEIVTFHPAFDYFADDFGLVVAATLTRDPGTAPSAREIAEVADIVRGRGVKALFVEPNYPKDSAEVVARETGVPMYTLDPATEPLDGVADEDVYVTAMERNRDALLEALGGGAP